MITITTSIITITSILMMTMSRSYLNVMDFPSAQSLAQELIRLDGNDTAYLEYFWWKVVMIMIIAMVMILSKTNKQI